MKDKLKILVYVIFAVVSFVYGVLMFKMGDITRGALFMLAVACWGMCIYNSLGMNRRQKQRISTSPSKNNNKKKSKHK